MHALAESCYAKYEPDIWAWGTVFFPQHLLMAWNKN